MQKTTQWARFSLNCSLKRSFSPSKMLSTGETTKYIPIHIKTSKKSGEYHVWRDTLYYGVTELHFCEPKLQSMPSTTFITFWNPLGNLCQRPSSETSDGIFSRTQRYRTRQKTPRVASVNTLDNLWTGLKRIPIWWLWTNFPSRQLGSVRHAAIDKLISLLNLYPKKKEGRFRIIPVVTSLRPGGTNNCTIEH